MRQMAEAVLQKTKILYKACLSHNQLKEYLTVLTESGLLNYDGQTHTFKTTEKGLNYQASQKYA